MSFSDKDIHLVDILGIFSASNKHSRNWGKIYSLSQQYILNVLLSRYQSSTAKEFQSLTFDAFFCFFCPSRMNSQVEKAIKVLQKIKPESTQDLIEKKQNIWVQFTVKKMNDKQKIKPILIPLAEPLQEYNICLFTKDPQHDYKQYASNNVKVMGITKLKQKYATFEQKRLLLKSYDLFLCDSRIVEFMPKLLGKHFFAKKKHPIVIDFSKNVESQIENVKNSTVLHLTKGVSTYV